MKTITTLSSFIAAFDRASKGRSFLQLFDDFLTLCMYSVTKLPDSQATPYDEEFCEIMEQYKRTNSFEDLLQMRQAYFSMISEKLFHPDMIGDFYMEIVADEEDKRILTPYRLCLDITELFAERAHPGYDVLDTSAGTGRMLLAMSRNTSKNCVFLGMEEDLILVKLASVNLFMHNLCGEISCTGGPDPGEYIGGYEITPKGIFPVECEAKSRVAYRVSKLAQVQLSKRILFV